MANRASNFLAGAGHWPVRALAFAALAAATPLYAQRGGGGGPAQTEEGIPVNDPLVISKCGTCHAKDDKGNLSRISWERTTPEGWEEAIKRMVRLNGLNIMPAEAKPILKYLATYHGLAPEEARPVMYFAEHRVQDEEVPNETVRSTCMNCHALGKAFSWRRSKEEWRLLTNMHSAFFPRPKRLSAGRWEWMAARTAAGALDAAELIRERPQLRSRCL